MLNLLEELVASSEMDASLVLKSLQMADAREDCADDEGSPSISIGWGR